MRDELGERMKSQYEHRTRFFVPRRTYTVIRLDGKAFHTYTRGLEKPFDEGLYNDMDNAIINMLPHIQGAVFAYTQSDEISVLVTDFATPTTSAWFDGNLQKMASVSSSIITAEFNKQRMQRYFSKNVSSSEHWNCENAETQQIAMEDIINYFPLKGSSYGQTAYFDSRIFTIPDRTEVMNYFIWRNQDCARNAVSMVAQSKFSHKELQGKSTANMQEMLFQHHAINWAKYRDDLKNGRLIVKESYTEHIPTKWSKGMCEETQSVERSKWVSKAAWKFTEDKDRLMEMIPKYV